MTINSLLSEETIANKIYFIRNQKVMLDRDLAILYGIETKRLKEQVKRNISRFPEDFMFELTKSEFENWRSQFATSNFYFINETNCFNFPLLLRSKYSFLQNITMRFGSK